ncbi:MAG: DUF1302 family protein [Candidatus Deferrimicrobiota bacterium]
MLLVSSVVWGEANDEERLLSGDRGLRLRGRVKEEVAVRLDTPRQLSKVKTVGWLDAKQEISDSVTLRLNGRGWWDAVYSLTDRYPENVARDQENDLSLREAMLSVSHGPFDLRVGLQQVVWGEAVGTFVTDVVNPKDFREFVLPEFTEIRIPLWMFDAAYAVGDNTVIEVVWTPEVRFNKIPERGSEFEFFRPPLPAGAIEPNSERMPHWTLRNSQGGVRASRIVSGWDLSVQYFDGVDGVPVLSRRQTGFLPNGTPVFSLTTGHHRLHMIGGTLGKSIEPVVVRSEFLYTVGKRYGTQDPLDADGVVRRDTLDYLLSAGGLFFGNLDATLQFSQKILGGAAGEIRQVGVEGRVTSTFSLRLASLFFDEKIQTSAIISVNANRGDYRISPRVEYYPAGGMKVAAGADLFGGPPDTLYGEFSRKDRMYTEIEYRY